jgi:KDO2-lipid IV(A) lauroyltransferase
MAIPVGNKLDLKLLAVAEPLDNQKVMTWFKSLREELGCEIILGGKGQNTFNLVQEKINNGYHVCLLSERSVNKSGVGTEFFGDLAAFPKGPVALALKTGVPIVPATFIKINNKYTLYFEKPFYVPHFENEAQSIQQGMKVLAKSFEKLISLDANQWHSIQPVWTDEY